MSYTAFALVIGCFVASVTSSPSGYYGGALTSSYYSPYAYSHSQYISHPPYYGGGFYGSSYGLGAYSPYYYDALSPYEDYGFGRYSGYGRRYGGYYSSYYRKPYYDPYYYY